LMIVREPNKCSISLAAASCAAASILLAAYPFGILDHYRIEWGKSRWGDLRNAISDEGKVPWEKLTPRRKGEPIEKGIVTAASALAVIAFVGVLLTRTN
jgi:hypothetical protein